MPRTSDHAPGADLVAQAGLAGHVRVVSGALPRPEPAGPAALAFEGVVTEKTAQVLHLKVGQTVHLMKFGANPLSVTISGIVAPRDPSAGYWTMDDDLLAPLVSYPPHLPIDPPHTYWHFTVLTDRTAARSIPLLGTGASMYWHHPLETSRADRARCAGAARGTRRPRQRAAGDATGHVHRFPVAAHASPVSAPSWTPSPTTARPRSPWCSSRPSAWAPRPSPSC